MRAISAKPLSFLPLILPLALLSSCGEKKVEPEVPEVTPPSTVTLSATQLNYDQAGGSQQLTIVSPSRPSLSSKENWVSFIDGTYKDYKITVGVSAQANDTYKVRTATVTVKCGTSEYTVELVQKGKLKPLDPVQGTNDAWKMAGRLALGWNMGNQLDAFTGNTPDETVWGNPKATKATFAGVKSAGFTSVRITVSWLDKIGPAPDYAVDAAWMARVKEVVGFARDAGLNVILNTHHDENNNDTHWLDIKGASQDEAKNTAIKAQIKGLWTNIATQFKDEGDYLIFESFNELQDGGWGWSDAFRKDPTVQCGILNDWNQVFVDAVRATGGNNSSRWLGVPTYAANPAFEQYFKLPSDPAGRVMLAVHFYDPSEYTNGDKQYSDWGHTGSKDKKNADGDEDHVRETFSNLNTKYVEKNVPVYLGEFGCSMRSKSDSRAWAFYKYYLEYVVKAAKTYGLPAFLWDNGAEGYGKQRHGYINHGTGNFMGNSKEVVDVMVKAMTSGDASYTLQSVYDKAPVF